MESDNVVAAILGRGDAHDVDGLVALCASDLYFETVVGAGRHDTNGLRAFLLDTYGGAPNYATYAPIP